MAQCTHILAVSSKDIHAYPWVWVHNSPYCIHINHPPSSLCLPQHITVKTNTAHTRVELHKCLNDEAAETQVFINSTCHNPIGERCTWNCETFASPKIERKTYTLYVKNLVCFKVAELIKSPLMFHAIKNYQGRRFFLNSSKHVRFYCATFGQHDNGSTNVFVVRRHG